MDGKYYGAYGNRRALWGILNIILDSWAHAGDNLTEREYAQWFYGTGKYANKE